MTDARAYEAALPRAHRRERGVYYTPPAVAKALVEQALAALPAPPASARILDPACGAGTFLVAAYRSLRERLPRARPAELLARLEGMDVDADAVALANAALSAEAGIPARVARAGDFLARVPAPRFHAVVGNPPWGQKSVTLPPAAKAALAARFPSSRGIFDWFRPFVEAGVRALAPGGACALVLPDIVLLKNYEATRRFLLDELTLLALDHLGMAFADATIDAVALVGVRVPAPAGHAVRASVDGLSHAIPQDAFRRTPRATFNLHLTAEARGRIRHLDRFRRLGEVVEVHEGVHSGNVRDELFVAGRVDASCRPLLLGRGELAPYRIVWGGRWLRLAAAPARRTPAAYANLGRPEWHERPKLLVRRTGDAVVAAVDAEGRWASNNFFVVSPRPGARWTLDALCALLNSRFMTEHFRTVEPRRGRAFAELKIKHLVDFPLPDDAADLDSLGAARRAAPADARLDAAIDARVRALFCLSPP
ncbi:MAG TPA: TaqI-like C-terminal specificity domain-containing protein [Haliangiales bacterium]|nr:TaqI-like C-terminal specificity domain-containing protein [Haliangiales bacterium]